MKKYRNLLYLTLFILSGCQNKNNDTHNKFNIDTIITNSDYCAFNRLDSVIIPKKNYNIDVVYSNSKRINQKAYNFVSYKQVYGHDYLIRNINYNTALSKNYQTIEYSLQHENPERIYIKIYNNKAILVRWNNDEVKEHEDEYIDSPIFKWGIGAYTQYVYANIDYTFFRNLFPEFKGKFLYDSTKTIEIDNSFKIDDDEYYKKIKFK